MRGGQRKSCRDGREQRGKRKIVVVAVAVVGAGLQATVIPPTTTTTITIRPKALRHPYVHRYQL